MPQRRNGLEARCATAAIAVASVAGALVAWEPTAAASAPMAPVGLTVNDREHHRNVEGAPRFGWLPRDRDGNEIQTAYRLRVFDRDGRVVWDSGKVASRAQSYVRYGGPDLDSGSTDAWSVRTWDRTDLASPWAGAAVFDTGIGDDEWEGAKWIRRLPIASQEADEYTLARTEIVVGAEPIARARAYTSAAHTYELYLNGRRADRGASFGYPGEQYYQAADVTSLVVAGKPLAIGALYHWYGAGQGRPAGEPGLLVKLVIEHARGDREVIITDESWRVSRATWFQPASPRRNGEGDRIDRQDARGAIPGWDRPFFDDSGWSMPEVVGAHPAGIFTHLVGQEPRIAETVVHPVAIHTAADGTPVADFGRVIPARPQVRFHDGVALAVDVLRVAGDIALELSLPDEAELYHARADQLVAAMNARLRRADGVYVDGLLVDGSQSAHAGAHSTSYAIAFGIAPPADVPQLANYLASLGMRQGPMTAHWLLEALAAADRADAVHRLLTDPSDFGWANILAQGATFTWEAWTLDPGTNFSQSHGWGAQAATDILGTMLGVRTSSPGAASVDIVVPRAVLDFAGGRVHTQRGGSASAGVGSPASEWPSMSTFRSTSGPWCRSRRRPAGATSARVRERPRRSESRTAESSSGWVRVGPASPRGADEPVQAPSVNE